ncbi:MAG: hypothetical protein Kow006_18540 [Gammaproteobacteria bacterium]
MKKQTIVLFQSVVLALLGQGQLHATTAELQPGQIYEGGTTISASSFGISFELPTGWRGSLPNGSEFFVADVSSPKGSVFILANKSTEADLKAQMSQPVPLDYQTTLVPVSQPRKEGQWYRAEYRIQNAPNLAAQIEGRVFDQTAVALIALSETGDKAAMGKSLKTLRNSFKSFQVKMPEPGVPAPAGSWQAYMQGRHVVRMFTRTGYTEEEHIWLCSDGRFYRTTNSGGFGGGASGAMSGRGNGRWHAVGNTNGEGQLILQYGAGYESRTSTPGNDYHETGPGGDRLVYALSLQNNKLYLDGRQWLRDGNQRCR